MPDRRVVADKLRRGQREGSAVRPVSRRRRHSQHAPSFSFRAIKDADAAHVFALCKLFTDSCHSSDEVIFDTRNRVSLTTGRISGWGKWMRASVSGAMEAFMTLDIVHSNDIISY